MPKVQKRKQLSKIDIENFANASDDTVGALQEEMIRTTVSFTSREHRKLKQLAQEDGRTLQAQVRYMLKEMLT